MVVYMIVLPDYQLILPRGQLRSNLVPYRRIRGQQQQYIVIVFTKNECLNTVVFPLMFLNLYGWFARVRRSAGIRMSSVVTIAKWFTILYSNASLCGVCVHRLPRERGWCLRATSHISAARRSLERGCQAQQTWRCTEPSGSRTAWNSSTSAHAR